MLQVRSPVLDESHQGNAEQRKPGPSQSGGQVPKGKATSKAKCLHVSEPQFCAVGTLRPEAQGHSGATWSPPPTVLYSNTLADETRVLTQGPRCPRDIKQAFWEKKSVGLGRQSSGKLGGMGGWGQAPGCDWAPDGSPHGPARPATTPAPQHGPLCPLTVPRVRGHAGLTNVLIQLAFCSLTVWTK